MIDDIKQDTEDRMGKALDALSHNFNKIRVQGVVYLQHYIKKYDIKIEITLKIPEN